MKRFHEKFIISHRLIRAFCPQNHDSGKGVPAALFMMMTKRLFRAYAAGESMPDQPVTC